VNIYVCMYAHWHVPAVRVCWLLAIDLNDSLCCAPVLSTGMTAWRMRNVHLMCVLRAEGKLMRRLLSSHWPFGHGSPRSDEAHQKRVRRKTNTIYEYTWRNENLLGWSDLNWVIPQFDSMIQFNDLILWFKSMIRIYDLTIWFDSMIQLYDSILWFDSMIRIYDSTMIRLYDLTLWLDSMIRFCGSTVWFKSMTRLYDSTLWIDCDSNLWFYS